jgi:hypothetical protein
MLSLIIWRLIDALWTLGFYPKYIVLIIHYLDIVVPAM